tara:strand:+ start:43 stop:648 length:606 start_codon:yes stop_codon:yes gene_type:complete
MKMFIDNEDHFNYLAKCLDDKPKHILFSSYGLYAGITYDDRDTNEFGEKYTTRTMQIMKKMQKLTDTDIRFLVGVTSYRSCKGKTPCIDCEKQYARGLLRVINHVSRFPEFNWRITTEHHLKAYLFFYDDEIKGVGGGRNFTNSNWADASFELSKTQIKQLYKHVQIEWDKGIEATNSTIGTILKEQGVSPDGLKAVTLGY